MADSNIVVTEELEKKLKKIQEIAKTVAVFKTNFSQISSTAKQRSEYNNEIIRLMEVYKQRKTISLISSRGVISNELEFNWNIRFYCRWKSGELLEKLALAEEDGLSNVA